MLEFEGFQACGAFELAKIRTVRVIRHMPLQLGQVGKLLGANGAWLQEIDSFIIPFLCINIMYFDFGVSNLISKTTLLRFYCINCKLWIPMIRFSEKSNNLMKYQVIEWINVTIMCQNDELCWTMSWVGCLLTD